MQNNTSMSLKKRSGRVFDNKEMETQLLNAKTILEKNIRAVKSELIILNEASVKLSKETGQIRDQIASNSEDLKQRIDKHVEKINKTVESTFQQNINGIETHRQLLCDKVKAWDSDVDKCMTALKKSPGVDTTLVSERKVLQMVLDSVNIGFVKPDLKLTRTAFLEKDSTFKDERLAELVGNIDEKEETLDDIHHDLFEIKSFQCPKFEINAIACEPEDRSVWTCMGTNLEIVNFKDNGDINSIAALDVKTDDIAIGPDGGILATTPDGHSVMRIDAKQVLGEVEAMEVFKTDVYIHGINVAMDMSKVILCATDKPNYSDTRPNETSIIEIRPDGSFIRKVKLKQFRGKVYRIAENVNGEYVLTFPKEGCVLSVDGNGTIKSAFSKQTGTPNKTIDRGRVFNLKEFWPTGVCCNSKGRIFVTDWLGKRVIILDSMCRYVRNIGTVYVNPNAVCINPNLDTIWIGDKGSIHVWQT